MSVSAIEVNQKTSDRTNPGGPRTTRHHPSNHQTDARHSPKQRRAYQRSSRDRTAVSHARPKSVAPSQPVPGENKGSSAVRRLGIGSAHLGLERLFVFAGFGVALALIVVTAGDLLTAFPFKRASLLFDWGMLASGVVLLWLCWDVNQNKHKVSRKRSGASAGHTKIVSSIANHGNNKR